MSFPLILAARLAKSLPNQVAWLASGNRTGQSQAVYLSLAATAGEAQSYANPACFVRQNKTALLS
ncbi:hypothetical protein BQ8794_30530 [Mesorhizobium prunaredense]|uniref:Uncharacterized protein n=1 Tax=Mesorhizobium prunaredense TaxID=1631249 RepID=A0A1R3VFB1_9HYPH|nr:hypothetical protein BQ8794_30530 [Mesorhizobium prunaredense]